MSKQGKQGKKGKQRPEEPAASEETAQERALALRKRRVFLGAHLLLQGLCVVGALGPWSQFYRSGEPIESSLVSGPDYVSSTFAPPPPEPSQPQLPGVRTVHVEREVIPLDEEGNPLPKTAEEPAQQKTEEGEPAEEPAEAEPAAPAEPGVLAEPGILAHLALLACIGAFFFASFDLVSDADIQLPILLCSLAAAACAGVVLYEFYALHESEQTIRSIMAEVEAAGGAASAGELDNDTLREMLQGLTLKLRWGAALFIASAPLLVITSAYLTFIAHRSPSPETP